MLFSSRMSEMEWSPRQIYLLDSGLSHPTKVHECTSLSYVNDRMVSIISRMSHDDIHHRTLYDRIYLEPNPARQSTPYKTASTARSTSSSVNAAAWRQSGAVCVGSYVSTNQAGCGCMQEVVGCDTLFSLN